jgi:hypothetical protein
MTTPAPPTSDDFLDDRHYSVVPSDDAAPPASASRRATAWTTAGWLAAGVVAGAIGVVTLHSGSSSNPTTTNRAAATGGLPGGAPGVVGGGVPSGGVAAGGVAGEQHLFGTLTAVKGTTFTVTTSSGASSYAISPSTLLVSHGQRVGALSSMTIGDQVVVHVYPQNGRPYVEAVIDAAGSGPPGGVQTT